MKSKKKKLNMKKLHENCDVMEACLYSILNFPSINHLLRTDDGYLKEIVYDKVAYKHLVDMYRYMAKIGLGIKP